MNDKKDQYVTLFQAGMLILNILAVGLICGFIYATTNRILAHYDNLSGQRGDDTGKSRGKSAALYGTDDGDGYHVCPAADLAAGSQPSDGLHTSGGRIRMCRTGRADGF